MSGKRANPNGFVVAWDEIKLRLGAPVRHIVFWTYLIIGIVILGGVPVWLEFFGFLATRTPENTASLRLALTVFFPALIGSTAMELAFETAGNNRRMLAVAFIAIFLFFGIFLGLTEPSNVPDYIAIPIAFVACIFAVLSWWIANGLNPTLRDEYDVESPVGGATSRAPAGDLTGFRTE